MTNGARRSGSAGLRLDAQVENQVATSDGELAHQAIAILEGNWMGHATRASARLYPHQWSWDSACIAIGYAGVDQSRAQAELRWLFASQWADGLLPHIRFADGGRYFPGPEFGRRTAPRARRRSQDLGDRAAARARHGRLARVPAGAGR